MDGQPHHHDTDSPQLRTLLLTDLCESTQLVERLGDSAAAALFRDHDRLVLELQHRWRGRLIDRSDGMLLLFERPLDGLGFALDYRRGLDALGQAHRVGPLLARSGLHVGELLVWRNSEEAVSAGAKPVEVEGLAKPFAARLMQLARPGQILLSSVAEPLVRRAARELGERGATLQWRTHGRWHFKGVPGVQEVHEVGEPGMAPLRMPRGDSKARRDLPAWRRPLALVAEVVLVGGVAIGIWAATRPQPAIAFAERDWVVVGDLRNLTGQTVLDDSLQQAFRISLEQSRYVNVLSDLKVRDTLARMQRDPATTRVDRAIGAEVAQRDGARLLILPTVAEVGGRVRFSAEIVDPRTQRTLAAESADGRGLESALRSIDQVTASLRNAMGESLASIQRDSAPLPDVTTSNLDALRAYALGQHAFGNSEYEKAAGFYARAVELDPDFALAYVGLLRSANAQVNRAEALASLREAMARKNRLPPREQLYLDAWNAQLTAPADALDKWRQMSELYPDFFPAYANVGYGLLSARRYADAMDYAMRATDPQSEFAALSMALVGQLHLGLENPGKAAEAFAAAQEGGVRNAPVGRAIALAARREFDRAHEVWSRQPTQDVAYFDHASILLDQGDWNGAIEEMRRQLAATEPGSVRNQIGQLMLASVQVLGGQPHARDALRQAMEPLLARTGDEAAPLPDVLDSAYAVLVGALVAQRIGDTRLSGEVLRRLKGQFHTSGDLPPAKLYLTVQAGQRLAEGDAAQAIALLEPALDGAEPVQAHRILLEAYRARGDTARSLRESRWLAAHRGRSYVEPGCGRCQQALNVFDTVVSHLDSAELLASSARAKDAAAELERFDGAWPAERLPDYLRRRREAVLAAFN